MDSRSLLVEPVPAHATRPGGLAPTDVGERVASIDVLRGFAVLGILLMNIVAMGLPYAAYDDPTIAGNRSAADFWCWAAGAVVAEGKMRAIFSMLFGAGVVLMARRVVARGASELAADLHLRRNLWLVAFGAIHSYLLLWPGEVLFTYGLAGVLLFAFRRLRPRTLLALAAVLLVLQIPRAIVENGELAEASNGLRELAGIARSGRALTAEERQSRDRWTASLAEKRPTPEMLQASSDARRGGYFQNVAVAASGSAYVESTYLYRVGLWDAAALMLIGMALLDLGVFSAARSLRFYVVLALVGYGIGLPLNIWVVSDWVRHGFEPGQRWTSLDDVTRVSIALGHVALVMAVCRTGAVGRATRALAAVGRLALTNYIAQTVICGMLFDGFGLGWFGQLARHQLYYVVGAVWLFQLIASTLWLRRFRLGPLEWVWRSLTYQHRQPFWRAGGAVYPVAG